MAPAPSVPEPVAELPDAFAEPAASGTTAARAWWESFEDPVLNAVVDSVLASNFDLAEAVARVQQARAQAGIARGRPLPRRPGDRVRDRHRYPGQRRLRPAVPRTHRHGRRRASRRPRVPRPARITTYSLGAEFAYELDFWGRARNDARAAGHEYLASESDYHAARIGVIAETITTYFEIVDLRSRVALTREAENVLLEREELAEARYDRGLTGSNELYQVRQELLNTRRCCRSSRASSSTPKDGSPC